MADVVMPKPPPSIPCRFDEAWKGRCGKPSTNGWCSRHEGRKCVVCGKQATKTCEYTGSQPLGCGVELCDTCRHEPYDRIATPFPSKHLSGVDYKKALKLVRENDLV